MKRLILALLVLSFFSFNAYASVDETQNLKAACASTVDGPKRDIKPKIVVSETKQIETSAKDAVKGI